MSDRWLLRGVALVLAVAVILMLLEARAQRQWRTDSAARLLAMEARFEKLDAEITDMQVSIAELQKHSVKNMVGRANDAMVDGFSSVMGALRDELEELSELMDESLRQEQAAPNPDANPPAN